MKQNVALPVRAQRNPLAISGRKKWVCPTFYTRCSYGEGITRSSCHGSGSRVNKLTKPSSSGLGRTCPNTGKFGRASPSFSTARFADCAATWQCGDRANTSADCSWPATLSLWLRRAHALTPPFFGVAGWAVPRRWRRFNSDRRDNDRWRGHLHVSRVHGTPADEEPDAAEKQQHPAYHTLSFA